ncbi:MAG TPA: iron-sulfur cluster assembly protein, partial [Paracoccaceae bacterium]|nr:iron-sulfur cluster assembly protein [Paracoccaceae bacterium]
MDKPEDKQDFVPAAEVIEAADKPPRARVDLGVEDAPVETAAEKLDRKRDYLEGFLAAKPAGLSPAEPGGDLYEEVIAALKDIFDPEIPVNIYDLGLIYRVDVTSDADVAITMTLTTPHCPVAESMPTDIELRIGSIPGVRDA